MTERSILQKSRWLIVSAALFIVLGFLASKPAQAASFTSKKPVIVTSASGFTNGKVVLSWSKVGGAKKYEVYRSKKKTGGYKKFTTSKKTGIQKAASGSYYYKVRAVKGSKCSKFSDPVMICCASAQITNVTFNGGFAYAGSYGLILRLAVANKTGSTMAFLAGNQGTIYLVDRYTGKVVGSTYAQLNTNNDMYGISVGMGKLISNKQTASLWFSSMTYTLWYTYQSNTSRYYFLISVPFYVGNSSTVYSITAGASASQSSVACRK